MASMEVREDESDPASRSGTIFAAFLRFLEAVGFFLSFESAAFLPHFSVCALDFSVTAFFGWLTSLLEGSLEESSLLVFSRGVLQAIGCFVGMLGGAEGGCLESEYCKAEVVPLSFFLWEVSEPEEAPEFRLDILSK